MMDYIRRLPYILGALVTIVVGLTSYISNISNQKIYYRMAISMIVFYLLGLYIRGTIIKIYEEVNKRNELDKIEKERDNQEQPDKTSTIDIKVDDQEDDFLPLEMSKAIKTVTLKDDADAGLQKK
jgi:hypothetical protein